MSAPKSDQTKKCSSLCKAIGLKPLTKDNVLYFYIPIQSMVSYAALSINVMNPSLAIRLFPKKDITNILLIHTLFGTTLYLYARPHLQSIEPVKRAAHCVVGSLLFGMGSVLIWAVIRNAAPRGNSGFTTMIGLTSGLAIARLSYDYLNHVDSKVAKIESA